ncbi:MAG: TetR/AcrR family transcriptional regulator [Myxococcales bacterium]|nr:TetR/AcrR family transcriptional regulator [Myxococcales bacterium]
MPRSPSSPSSRRRAAPAASASAPESPAASATPAAPGRRERQRLETERLIQETALALFIAHGFEATTTKQIAEAAGVAHGTVFLVAATKEALLVKVLEARLREVVAGRAASLPKRRIVAQLVHVFDGLFDFYAAEPRLSRVFLKGIMFFAEPIARAMYDEHVARFSGYLAMLFDAAKARGEVAARTASAFAAGNVLALYVYVVVAFLNADVADRTALGASFRAGLDELARGFAAQNPRQGAVRRASPGR